MSGPGSDEGEDEGSRNGDTGEGTREGGIREGGTQEGADTPTPPQGTPASPAGRGEVPSWHPGGGPSQGSPSATSPPQQGPPSGGAPSQGYGPPPGGPGQGPYGPGGRPPAPKPGVVPLRPLALGEVLDGAVSYIRAHPGVVLGASAVVAVITQLLQIPVLYSAGQQLSGVGPTPSPEDLGAFVGTTAGGSAVSGLISAVALAVLTGLLIVVISRAVLGAEVSAGESWRAVRGRVPGLIGLSLLVALLVVVVVAVCFLPGVLSAVAGGPGLLTGLLLGLGALAALAGAVAATVLLSLSSPAYVLEGVGVVPALRRSVALVRTRFWPVLGVLLLAFVIGLVIQLIISGLFGFLSAATTTGATDPAAAFGLVPLLVQAVGAILASTVVTPFQAGVTGLLYVDQRMRREGFDIELQRATATGPPG